MGQHYGDNKKGDAAVGCYLGTMRLSATRGLRSKRRSLNFSDTFADRSARAIRARFLRAGALTDDKLHTPETLFSFVFKRIYWECSILRNRFFVNIIPFSNCYAARHVCGTYAFHSVTACADTGEGKRIKSCVGEVLI